jgi:hypothetical protein
LWVENRGQIGALDLGEVLVDLRILLAVAGIELVPTAPSGLAGEALADQGQRIEPHPRASANSP